MFVAVLSNRSHSAEDTALISRIEDSVNAVESLLNGLLDVSKLEAGLVVPAPNAFNISPMLERLSAEFEPQAEAVGLRLRTVLSRAVVRSDSALLERILRNFLNNAVRYTREGGVLFGCRHLGDKLRIEVWDTGIGIPQSQIKAIFREFHQLGNPGRDRRQGLGLGLAIVERLAQLLGHPITVRSTPQKGSVFAIDVPLAASLENVAEPRQLNLGMSRKGASIVVIEDEPDVLESLRLLLESWGFLVITGRDCDQALRNLSEFARVPDLILADYRLQNSATGGQAISRIRQRLKAPSIPAIILTGDTAPERLRQAQQSGHGLLHKPVQPLSLRQMIDEVLAKSPVPSPLLARSG
jgi:CheY-like chemotaxis protein